MKRILISLLMVLFVFVSCKQKTREEMIVGTWKLNVDKEERKITFYKDLTMEMTSSASMKDHSNGTYKLVHDGKYLDTWEKGRSDTDELEIISINETSFQLRNAKDSRLITLTR
jgi:hypothetical protein